jgi:acetoin utilization deacetylase AcuC-like enzyme
MALSLAVISGKHGSELVPAGWCAYSDITMAIQQVRAATSGAVRNVWVIDTDAHQGNGYARDKLHLRDEHLMIVDLYNSGSALMSSYACVQNPIACTQYSF